MKNKNNKKYFRSLLFCLFLIGITFYTIFNNSEIGQLQSTIREAKPVYLVLGLLFMLLFVLSEAFSIWVLTKSLAYPRSFLKCLKYSFLGFYFCSITPSASGGQPVQVFYMKKDGIPVGASTLSILVVTVSYQIGILMVGLIMFLLKPALISENLGLLKYFVIYGVGMNLCLITVFVSIAFHNIFMERILWGCIRLLARLNIIKNADAVLQKATIQLGVYRKSADFIKRKPRVLLLVLSAILIQVLCRLSIAYAVYKALGCSGYNYFDIIALQAMLALAVESLPIPGAIGASETGFLTVNKMIFGAERTMTAMLLSRGISFYAFLLLSGGVALGAQIALSRRFAQNPDSQV